MIPNLTRVRTRDGHEGTVISQDSRRPHLVYVRLDYDRSEWAEPVNTLTVIEKSPLLEDHDHE